MSRQLVQKWSSVAFVTVGIDIANSIFAGLECALMTCAKSALQLALQAW